MSLILKEFWFLGSLLPSLFFPVGLQRGSITTILGLFVRPSRGKTVTRWELLEINNGCNEVRRAELNSVQTKPQEVRGWEEVSWEESDLTRFSNFLGFLTEGLEKDILDFLVKIRKRRERIHSKTLLEKSKFENELKRLECTINYERGKKQKCGMQGRGCQIMEVQ